MSWWDRELNLYRVHRSNVRQHENDGDNNLAEAESRKLAAKVALKVRLTFGASESY